MSGAERSRRDADRLAGAFIDACLLDVTALKPGNVGLHAGGHGMRALDFVRSAAAAAAAIAARGASVGERIHGAIAATRRVVAANTNLGIVLLAAPVIHAAALQRGPRSRDALARRLRAVLAGLTVADAALAFAAIRAARPGGLGTSPRHDVRELAQATLLEAMREAAARDLIARQYASGYADVTATGLERVAVARARGCDWRWTATAVYLAFLARHPDSHVARKHGVEEAERVRVAASEYDRAAVAAARDAAALAEPLLRWDGELKARGINPGTSADLTAATLLFGFVCEPQVADWARRGERRGADESVGISPTG
jgi:triphosphoribosyl-dephospho-CoA synthase